MCIYMYICIYIYIYTYIYIYRASHKEVLIIAEKLVLISQKTNKPRIAIRLGLYIYIYIYIYIFIYICIYMYFFLYIYIYTYVYVSMYMYVCGFIIIAIRIFKQTSLSMFISLCFSTGFFC
jgi:hypothetical protein